MPHTSIKTYQHPLNGLRLVGMVQMHRNPIPTLLPSRPAPRLQIKPGRPTQFQQRSAPKVKRRRVDLQDGRTVGSSSREDDGSHTFQVVDIEGTHGLTLGAGGLHEIEGAGRGGGDEEGTGRGGGGGGGSGGRGSLVMREFLDGVEEGLGRADVAGEDHVLREGRREGRKGGK